MVVNTPRRLTWFHAAIALVMIAAVIARLIPGTRTIDDAFITFRYSRNIVEGIGFVYNPDVLTLGTTTPLFTLILAGVGAIVGGGDYPNYALVISALADAITCALLIVIARRIIRNDVIALLPGVLWAVSPMSVTFAIGGMETSVNILWMTAAVTQFTHPNRRPIHEIGLGVCAALGVITRIDAVLWIAPLFAWQLIEGLIRTRRLPAYTWVAAAFTYLPWLIFAWAYFHTPIPNSINAKSVAYSVTAGSALVRFIQTYATPFSEFETFGSIGAMIGSVLYFLLSVVAVVTAARRMPRLIAWLIYPWLYMIVFSAANPLIFRWYVAPPLPALMIGIIVGVWAVFNREKAPHPPTPSPSQAIERGSSTRRLGVILTGFIGLVWVFTSINGWMLHPDHGWDRPAPRMAWHEIELLYQQVGTMLRDEYGVTPETRVASADIGAVGYFSRAVIVDTVGLVTPELRQYYPFDPALLAEGQNYAIPPALIRDTAPEYLVTMEGFIRNGLAGEDWFNEQYAVIREIPVEFYGAAMLVFTRR